nr:putative small periplasmic lipoprotein [Bartonella schoenbuchensis]CDP79554.1 putative small periplasmic lipoprotein [Bartonella schoenbuchensis]
MQQNIDIRRKGHMRAILKNLIIVLFFNVVIVGCGRKGALELPSSTTVESSQGAFVSERKADKPFILDRLIQ